MNDTAVYAKQGFGKSLVVRAPVGLLIVDFVNGFADSDHFGGGNILRAIANTIPVLDFFRRRKLPVAHTRIVFADDGSDASVFAEKVPSLLTLTEHNPLSAIVDILRPEPGELVVRKTQPSAFAGTGLSVWLATKGVRSLVICGCVTSGCVRASVVDAMQTGLVPIVPVECVGDRAIAPHDASLFDIGQKYGNVVLAAEVAGIVEHAAI